MWLFRLLLEQGARVICWINGSFGAGKTTLAGELRRRCPGALLYDPEQVGFMLRDVVPPALSGDFQDLRAWRLLVVETGRVLTEQYGRLIITPMTVVNPAYAQEIFDGLAAYGVPVRHFFLKVPAARLRERISAQVIHPHDVARDAGVRRWRLAQVDRCTAAMDALPGDTVVLDGEMPVARLADEVLDVLGQDARFALSGSTAGG
jgi:AAA domain